MAPLAPLAKPMGKALVNSLLYGGPDTVLTWPSVPGQDIVILPRQFVSMSVELNHNT